ncbi:hypothetical protein JNUCC0626_50240 (plasmid) [Lentzea sp. JNUCC 0626]|uniref:hypothetical protein n=1 Tax=Lentzea sp. JNUCC 0626 TaxID=3367513 RepID=UPI0037498A48
MMRPVEISPDVAGVLGPELVDRMTSDAWDQVVQCWECGRLLPPEEPAAVLLLWPVDAAAGTVQLPVQVHQNCARSEIRRTTVAELQARTVSQPAGPDADLDVVATMWDLGDGTGYPALFISFRDEVLLGDGPERIDGVVAALTMFGWHPVDALAVVPGLAPHGWRARFGIVDFEAGRGRLELINPGGEVETEATVYDAQGWLLAVQQLGGSAVIMGSKYLSNWLIEGAVVAADRAARNGRLVGGIVPVTLHSAR